MAMVPAPPVNHTHFLERRHAQLDDELAELEAEMAGALPDGCEVEKVCGHLCGEDPRWVALLRCGCPEPNRDDQALICDGHSCWIRTADLACSICWQPITLTGIRRLGAPSPSYGAQS